MSKKKIPNYFLLLFFAICTVDALLNSNRTEDFLHSSGSGHLGCFSFGAIINKSTCVCVFFSLVQSYHS